MRWKVMAQAAKGFADASFDSVAHDGAADFLGHGDAEPSRLRRVLVAHNQEMRRSGALTPTAQCEEITPFA
jgi:hypothetical protein